MTTHMTIKTFLTAAALIAAPVLASACPSHEEQVMSCAEGSVYNPVTNACTVVTG
jgi:hypothetical protein